MGTPGFICFVADDTEKITYNHHDSNPSDLGVVVLSWLRATDHTVDADAARRLRMVACEATPTRAEADRLGWPAAEMPRDMYSLLSATIGDPAVILVTGMATDWPDLPMSPSCLWGYVVDYDTQRFEVYSAYSKDCGRGRFVGRDAAVHLAGEWPLASLPTAREFVAKFVREYGYGV